MAAILTALEERDVLFVDEIHRLNRAVEEILYPALEDFRLDIIIGQGPAARTLDARPAAVHARRRDDAQRPADDAAPRPLRDDLPARLLRRRAARDDRPPLGGDPRRRDRGRRGRARSRAARAARRGSRTGSCAAFATSRRCGTRARSRREIAREALELLEVDDEGLERIDRELLRGDRAQVRRRSGRALDARRHARRGDRTRSRTSTSRTCSSSASSSERRAAG